MERCDLSDLPVAECACRVHKPGQAYDARQAQIDVNPGTAGYGGPVAARFHGRCQACGDGITPGESIRADLSAPGRAAWIHADCAD